MLIYNPKKEVLGFSSLPAYSSPESESVASDRRLTPGTKEMGMKLEVRCSWIGVLDSGQILQGPKFLFFLSLKTKWMFPPGLTGATKGCEKVYKLCSPVGKYFISAANQPR